MTLLTLSTKESRTDPHRAPTLIFPGSIKLGLSQLKTLLKKESTAQIAPKFAKLRSSRLRLVGKGENNENGRPARFY
jgi:hypothetical protein